MKKILLIILLTGLWVNLSAQSIQNKVIASGGATYVKPTAQLEFTLGETFVQTFTKSTAIITQGFHQPSLTVARITDEPNSEEVMSETIPVRDMPEPANFKFNAYPNPVTNLLYIEANGDYRGKAAVIVMDANGRTVQEVTLDGSQTTIDFSGSAPGTYLLRVVDSSFGAKETFRVIKTE